MTVNVSFDRDSDTVVISTAAILADKAIAHRGTQWLEHGDLVVTDDRVSLTLPWDSPQLPLAISIVEGSVLAHRESLARVAGTHCNPDDFGYFTIEEIAQNEDIDAKELRAFAEQHRFIAPGVGTHFHPLTGKQAVTFDDYARLVRRGMRLTDNLAWTTSTERDLLAVGVRDDARRLTAWSSFGGLNTEAPREIVTFRGESAALDLIRKSGAHESFTIPGERNLHVYVPHRWDTEDFFDDITRPLGTIGIDIRFTYLGREIESGWRDSYPGGSTTDLPYREIGGW